MTDAGSRILKAFGRGCARSLVLQIGLVVLIFGGFFTIVLFTIFFTVDSDQRIWQFVACLLGFMGLVIAATVVWAIITLRRRARMLDRAFEHLGLEASMYLISGRQYHGTVRGYPVNVYFYRGPTVDIYVQYPFRTRVGISLKSGLNTFTSTLMEREPLQITDPAFEDLVVYAMDPEWASDLLQDAYASRAMLELVQPAHDIEVRNVVISPGSVRLQMRYTHTRYLSRENINQWVDGLIEIVRAAKSAGIPQVTVEETQLEQSTRTSRHKYVWWIVGIIFGGIGLMTACIIVVAMLLINLTESGSF